MSELSFDPNYVEHIFMVNVLLDKYMPAEGTSEELRKRLEDASIDLKTIDRSKVPEIFPLCKENELSYIIGCEVLKNRKEQENIFNMTTVFAIFNICRTAYYIVQCKLFGTSFNMFDQDIMIAREFLQPPVRERLEKECVVECEIIDNFEEIVKGRYWKDYFDNLYTNA